MNKSYIRIFLRRKDKLRIKRPGRNIIPNYWWSDIIDTLLESLDFLVIEL